MQTLVFWLTPLSIWAVKMRCQLNYQPLFDNSYCFRTGVRRDGEVSYAHPRPPRAASLPELGYAEEGVDYQTGHPLS